MQCATDGQRRAGGKSTELLPAGPFGFSVVPRFGVHFELRDHLAELRGHMSQVLGRLHGRVSVQRSALGRLGNAGKTWRPINHGLNSKFLPDPIAEVGHCVHRLAMHKARPGLLYMQKHWDVMRSEDACDSWTEVSGNLPTDFGFVIDVHAHEPETIYVVPITSDSEHYPPDGKLSVYRSHTGGNESQELTKGLPQRDCYVNVLREAMAVDSLDRCGMYFGTTGGQVYASADAGDSWSAVVQNLPGVLSVEVQTLP